MNFTAKIRLVSGALALAAFASSAQAGPTVQCYHAPNGKRYCQVFDLFGPMVHSNGFGIHPNLVNPLSIGGGYSGHAPAMAGPMMMPAPYPMPYVVYYPVTGYGGGMAQGAMPGYAMMAPQAAASVQCTFGENTLLLASSVADCETAGGAATPPPTDAAAQAKPQGN